MLLVDKQPVIGFDYHYSASDYGVERSLCSTICPLLSNEASIKPDRAGKGDSGRMMEQLLLSAQVIMRLNNSNRSSALIPYSRSYRQRSDLVRHLTGPVNTAGSISSSADCYLYERSISSGGEVKRVTFGLRVV